MSKKEETIATTICPTARSKRARPAGRSPKPPANHSSMHGYAGATLSAIAQEAGVAVETIYATFGSKRACWAIWSMCRWWGMTNRSRCWRGPRAGDRTGTRPAPADPPVRGTDAGHHGAHGPALRHDAHRGQNRAGHRGDARPPAGIPPAGNAAFRPGACRPRAAAGGAEPGNSRRAVFALSSGELFAVLTADLDWSGEAYEAWLAETLIATLLA